MSNCETRVTPVDTSSQAQMSVPKSLETWQSRQESAKLPLGASILASAPSLFRPGFIRREAAGQCLLLAGHQFALAVAEAQVEVENRGSLHATDVVVALGRDAAPVQGLGPRLRHGAALVHEAGGTDRGSGREG